MRFNLEVGFNVVQRKRGRRFWKPVVGDDGCEENVFKTSIAAIE